MSPEYTSHCYLVTSIKNDEAFSCIFASIYICPHSPAEAWANFSKLNGSNRIDMQKRNSTLKARKFKVTIEFVNDA